MITTEKMDGFDRLPDPLITLIFNSVSDIKTLVRCRSVSKRFHSLVPQTDSLLLRIDRVISDPDSYSLLFSLLMSLLHLFGPTPARSKANSACTPARILSQFERIRFLTMELPAGDLNKLEKGAIIRWRADFGKSLRSCVILGFRSATSAGGGGDVADFEAGLKERVVWAISALLAASARHYLLRDVVRGRVEMERVVLGDREGEGTVVMEKDGLMECRVAAAEEKEEEDESEEERSRTAVPSVRMRMRHAPRLWLKGGDRVEGATLVVVRPCISGGGDADEDDAELALGAFGGGVYGEAVKALLKSKSYLVEMNSF